MKKKIISVISLLLTSTMLFACNDKATGTNMFEYEETSLDTNKKLNMDADFKIDGKGDEYVSQNAYSFQETKSGINVESKAFLGEKGLFVYTYVDDTSVYVSSEKAFYQNDSVEYYINPNPLKSMSLSELNDNVIVKRKIIENKPMSEEEAILQMELLGHQFYMYKDSDTNKPAVVYKRNDGNYGVIESE